MNIKIAQRQKNQPELQIYLMEHIMLDNSNFMFRTSKGGMMYAKWVERKFEKLLELCRHPKDFCRVHDLRGQYVDLMHLCGVPLVHISRQVGHSNPKITANGIYSNS